MRSAFLMGALALALAGGAIAGQTAPKARAPKSPEELKALQGMFATFQGNQPDAVIAAAEDFVAKYPQSDFKALAFLAEAQSYQQKNDYDHLVVFGEEALESNPDDATKVEAFLMLARAISLKTGEYDLDREEKLAKVEKYCNSALETLKTMPKPNPALPDPQWEVAKADMTSQAHTWLGVDQMSRKDYDKAIAEFKVAAELSKDGDPSIYVRLASAYEKAEKYDDAVAACDKALAAPNLPPGIKAAAGAEKAHALKLKGAAPAAKP